MFEVLLHTIASFLCPYVNVYCEEDKIRDNPYNDVCDSPCEVATCNGTIYAHWFCSMTTRKIPQDWVEPDFYNVCLVFLDHLASEQVGMEILASKLR